jgi:gamma-glutamyltranspeptidase/glutathione hydrolase
MIATSQSLASVAGLRAMQEGGNAIDAAITSAAVLAVIEPSMNGIGGDFFALVYDAKTKTLKALNASGRSGAAATPAYFAGRKMTSIPYRGELSVSVPGVVDGWAELLAKHGTITLAQALAPAIRHAREGYAVGEVVAWQWADAESTLARDPAAAKTFLIDGHAPVRVAHHLHRPQLTPARRDGHGEERQDERHHPAMVRPEGDGVRIRGVLEA